MSDSKPNPLDLLMNLPAGDFAFAMPSPEEAQANMERVWNRAAHAAIDQWPDEIAALSVPTILIPLDLEDITDIFEYHKEGWDKIMQKYADLIDKAIGWEPHFIRLSTRSPKDVTQTYPTITCSGKQAMDWISNSMRCMDDICIASGAKKPIFIALRKVYQSHPGGEFRCFAKDGKMIAVSRYDYDNEALGEYDGDAIFSQLSAWYEEHIAPHYQTIVFDVELFSYGENGKQNEPLLIEVNPYGLSDPCLFKNYDVIESEGGFRA